MYPLALVRDEYWLKLAGPERSRETQESRKIMEGRKECRGGFSGTKETVYEKERVLCNVCMQTIICGFLWYQTLSTVQCMHEDNNLWLSAVPNTSPYKPKNFRHTLSPISYFFRHLHIFLSNLEFGEEQWKP